MDSGEGTFGRPEWGGGEHSRAWAELVERPQGGNGLGVMEGGQGGWSAGRAGRWEREGRGVRDRSACPGILGPACHPRATSTYRVTNSLI